MIEIDPRSAFCPVHLEPFRAQWPNGYVQAAVLAFSAFASLDEVQTYARGDANVLSAAVREMGPMCCAIDPVLWARIVAQALDPTAPDGWVGTMRDEIIADALRRKGPAT